MFVFVSGAVRSGKSRWAEECIRHAAHGPLVYLATARVRDQEMHIRVGRHRALRRDRGFETVERPADVAGIVAELAPCSAVLLECLGTLAANEMFGEDGDVMPPDAVVSKIYQAVSLIKARVSDLVIVSNDVFSDGAIYQAGTEDYRRALGTLHVLMARECDVAVECVCGLPVIHKRRQGGSAAMSAAEFVCEENDR